METLKIVTFATGEYMELVERIFLPTLPDDIDRQDVSLYNNTDTALPGATDDPVYKQKMLDRIQYYREYIRQHLGEKVLFLDCDVVFLRPFKEEILEALKKQDFVMQKHFNAGIWGANCNERSLAFFNYFVDFISAIPPTDRPDGFPQPELESAIKEWHAQDRLKALELPEEYGYLTPNTRIYHAVNGGKTVFAKWCILTLAQAYQPEEDDHHEKSFNWIGCLKTEDVEKFAEKVRIARSTATGAMVYPDAAVVEDINEILTHTAHKLSCLWAPSWIASEIVATPMARLIARGDPQKK